MPDTAVLDPEPTRSGTGEQPTPREILARAAQPRRRARKPAENERPAEQPDAEVNEPSAAPPTRRRRKPDPEPVAVRPDDSTAVQAVQTPPRRRRKPAAPALEPTPVVTAIESEPSGRRVPLIWLLPIAAATLVLALAGLAWQRSPEPDPVRAIELASDSDPVPRDLLRRWLLDFPERNRLLGVADPAIRQSLADHLAQQNAVASVERIVPQWVPDADGGNHRALVLELRLRQPVLPLRRQDGRIDWVDTDGRILPGELTGPEGEPRLHGSEEAPPEALAEVLSIWPQLKAAMQELSSSGRFRCEGSGIDRILLHEPLSSRTGRSERGIVFVLAGPAGTRLVWGRAGEAAYGMSPERKLANFVHTLTCQGSRPEDLRRVQDINVRFPEPFAVVAR